MPKNVRVVFQKGVLNYIGVPLLVSQQNTKPARPVYNNRGTGSGTLWDRYSKDLISYLASAADLGGDLGEAFWEAYSEEGFIQDTRDGLVIFEENPTPINPVQRKPKTGTRSDRVAKVLPYLKFYTGNPEKKRILEIWVAENMRVSKPMRTKGK